MVGGQVMAIIVVVVLALGAQVDGRVVGSHCCCALLSLSNERSPLRF